MPSEYFDAIISGAAGAAGYGLAAIVGGCMRGMRRLARLTTPMTEPLDDLPAATPRLDASHMTARQPSHDQVDAVLALSQAVAYLRTEVAAMNQAVSRAEVDSNGGFDLLSIQVRAMIVDVESIKRGEIATADALAEARDAIAAMDRRQIEFFEDMRGLAVQTRSAVVDMNAALRAAVDAADSEQEPTFEVMSPRSASPAQEAA